MLPISHVLYNKICGLYHVVCNYYYILRLYKHGVLEEADLARRKLLVIICSLSELLVSYWLHIISGCPCTVGPRDHSSLPAYSVPACRDAGWPAWQPGNRRETCEEQTEADLIRDGREACQGTESREICGMLGSDPGLFIDVNYYVAYRSTHSSSAHRYIIYGTRLHNSQIPNAISKINIDCT